MNWSFLVPAYLALCLILGGASLGGYLSNMVLQLLAIPIILAAFLVGRKSVPSKSSRTLMLITGGLLAVLVLQLAPLPPDIWSALPGRARVAEGFAMVGRPLPWLPLSLAPERGLATILWMLPALAILVGILRLGAFSARGLAWVLVAVTFVSIVVAAGQTGNQNSPLYFYDVTNRGFGVGFFANANHQATLMVATIAFLTALLLSRPKRRGARGRSGKPLGIIVGFAVLAVGIAVNGSLAGLGLAVPAVATSLLLSKEIRRPLRPLPALIVIALVSLAAVAAILFGPLGNNLTAPVAGNEAESRQTSIGITAKAGVDYLPLGTGLGSFETIYQSYENPNAVGRQYMNHAHSDYAEIFLELGLPGVLLVLGFLVWWLRRTISIWRDGDDLFARAATISSGVILAHSIVDYPLRTVAIGAVFALCCALMAEPRERGRRIREDEGDRPRHLTA